MTRADDLFLAIDQGGHASRVIAVDRRGAIVTAAFREIATARPSGDRVEHDADEVETSVRDALAAVVDSLGARAGDVRAAGLATQRSSVVGWDRETGTALSPVISWQDRRNAAWLRDLELDPAEVASRTGLVLSPHYGASKLRWCFDHAPGWRDAQTRGRLACGPLAAFLLSRLLEERPLAVDAVNASRTLLWDLDRRDWSPELLDAFGVPRSALPGCVPTRHPFGHLAVGDRRVPLVVATGDQPAALFAGGEPGPGTVFVNIGTGAFAQRVIGARRPAPADLLTGVAGQDGDEVLYVLEGTVNGAGSAIDVVSREVGLDPAATRAHAASWLDAVVRPPLFLNGVGGLGSPYWSPSFASRFVTEDAEHDARAKVVAAIESIAFLLAVNVEAMTRDAPRPDCIVVSGGLATLDGLCAILSDLTGLAVERGSSHEATGRGLAYLVAGRPPEWRGRDVDRRFSPGPTGALHARFLRWRDAMRSANA